MTWKKISPMKELSAFYGLSSSNFKEAVRILIDGKQVGELTHFYTDLKTRRISADFHPPLP